MQGGKKNRRGQGGGFANVEKKRSFLFGMILGGEGRDKKERECT